LIAAARHARVICLSNRSNAVFVQLRN